MKKHDLIAGLQRSHTELRAVIDALSDAELALPAQGEWTRRDLVAHIEWWERHSTGVIVALLEGRDPHPTDEPFDLDTLNARVFEENRGRTAAEVRSGEAAAWVELARTIEAAGDADLFEADRFAWTEGTPLAEIIHGDTDRHWEEHLPHLRPASASTIDAAVDKAR
jgi:hypothetical protein